MGIAIESAQSFTGIANPLIKPNITVAGGLQGAYWLTSGVESKCLLDFSGNRRNLTKVGAPLFRNGRVVMGGGNGFQTGLNETASYTYLAFYAREENIISAASSNVMTIVGDFNDDPAVNDYSGRLTYIDSTPASNNVATYRGNYHYNLAGVFTETLLSIGTNNATAGNRTFADGVRLSAVAITINATTETARLFIPRVQQNPLIEQIRTAGQISGRRLLTDAGLPINIALGVVDDATLVIPFNAALAAAFIYNRALEPSEIMAQYNATNAQLLGLSPGFEFPSRYTSL